MTEQTETPSKELTLDQKLDTIFSVIVENNNMLKSLLQALEQLGKPTATPGVPYQPGYPTNPEPATRPVNEFANVYGEEQQYSSPDEPYRNERTYTQMPTPQNMGQQTQQQPAPSHHPPPIPPGGMPPQQEPPPSVGGERVMTPEQYREAHPE